MQNVTLAAWYNLPCIQGLAKHLSVYLASLMALLSMSWPAQAQTGTSTDPFTSLSQINRVSSSGVYYFNLGSGQFKGSVRYDITGNWLLVLQYHHKGGTNPNLNIIGPGSDFPQDNVTPVGTDDSADLSKWGHAGNAAMSQFPGNFELWFYGRSSDHLRAVNFTTTIGDDYVRTGIGSFAGLSTSFTPIGNHSSFLPGAAGLAHVADQGDIALTNFPFYVTGNYYWSMRGGNNRWEVDDAGVVYSQDTVHKTFVRQVIDRGESSSSCPYTHNFNGEMPYYDSIPYYAPGNSLTQNGQQVSSFSGIATDADGSGKFLMNSTAGASADVGEMFGSPDNLAVNPNTYYTLSFKLASSDGFNREQIRPEINGVPIASAVSTTSTGSWENFEFVWYSGANTSADFSLVNLQSSASGNSFGLDDVSLCESPLDHSDAPISYGDATHLLTGTHKLGTAVDGDIGTIASNDANGDGGDDDGVVLRRIYRDVTHYHDFTVSGADGYLQGWIDWNKDGDFDDIGEQIISDLADGATGDLLNTAGQIRIAVRPPVGITPGTTFARFRWSSTSGLDAITQASDGEVEDYQLSIEPDQSFTSVCVADAQNLAAYGTADQVSDNYGAVASRAIDGNTDGLFSNGSVTHTLGDAAPFWELNLGQSILIDHIEIWTRTDCCLTRLTDFYLLVSDTIYPRLGNTLDNLLEALDDTSVIKYQYTGYPNPNVTLPMGVRGQYITIVVANNLPSTQFLSLAEVKVMSCNTSLEAQKSVTIWNSGNGGYTLPDNDIIYTITTTNTGLMEVDNGSIFLIDQIPSEVEFYNGDIDDGGPETMPVAFSQSSGAGLSYTYNTDVGYSNAATPPTSFAQCNYTPLSGYDASVTYVCFNPKGTFTYGDPNPEFSLSFRARIK